MTGVTSAIEASGAIVRDEPALVLVDPAMPVVGENVVHLIRDALGTNPALVVLFSSQATVELAEKVRELGAHAFIEKSGDAHTFARHVRSMKLPTEVGAPGAVADIAQPQQEAGVEPTPDAKTILVAGGDWLTHGALLPRAGFSVEAVASARAVLDSLRTCKPALLVVGPNLADATTIELCRTVRADPLLRRVSILFVGEAYDDARSQEMREAGANEALLRPLDEMSLFQTVGRLASIAARRKARLLVRIEIQVEQGGEFCVGFTHNVSASGMLLETDRPLQQNQPLTVRFFIPGCGDEIEALVDVVRIQETQGTGSVVGVRFDDIHAEYSEAIDDFVHRG